MEKCNVILCVEFLALLLIYSNASELRHSGSCPWAFHGNSSCSRSNFLCFNWNCIDRGSYCNGINDCGDNSDEQYCDYYYDCPQKKGMFKCPGTRKCILNEWLCDGIKDCNHGNDEKSCENNEQSAKARALQWLQNQKVPQSATGMWGSFVDKSAVALYLASNTSARSGTETRKEMAYEISIQLLSRLSKNKLRDIPSNDLASYVNAFLVTCLDPRKFHGLDIIQELRSRVNIQNYTSPYVLLSLCNAGDTITEMDQMKLIDAFRAKRRAFWTDVQAVAVMALACASRQPESDVDLEIFRELVLELKQHQYRNGTVENLQTTALVMQALLSAESDADPDNFDEIKALQRIVAMQRKDGSFGNFQNTYYALPVLNCKSFVNISSDHCEHSTRDEISALEDLANRSGPKIRVRYSLWIGNGKDLERNLALRVPANMSFYQVMEMAAEIDSRYRFEYVVKDRKPYVNALSGYQDDPERDTFWFLYTFVEGKPTPSQDSPADIRVKDNEHFVMWYRSGSWIR